MFCRWMGCLKLSGFRSVTGSNSSQNCRHAILSSNFVTVPRNTSATYSKRYRFRGARRSSCRPNTFCNWRHSRTDGRVITFDVERQFSRFNVLPLLPLKLGYTDRVTWVIIPSGIYDGSCRPTVCAKQWFKFGHILCHKTLQDEIQNTVSEWVSRV